MGPAGQTTERNSRISEDPAAPLQPATVELSAACRGVRVAASALPDERVPFRAELSKGEVSYAIRVADPEWGGKLWNLLHAIQDDPEAVYGDALVKLLTEGEANDKFSVVFSGPRPTAVPVGDHRAFVVTPERCSCRELFSGASRFRISSAYHGLEESSAAPLEARILLIGNGHADAVILNGRGWAAGSRYYPSTRSDPTGVVLEFLEHGGGRNIFPENSLAASPLPGLNMEDIGPEVKRWSPRKDCLALVHAPRGHPLQSVLVLQNTETLEGAFIQLGKGATDSRLRGLVRRLESADPAEVELLASELLFPSIKTAFVGLRTSNLRERPPTPLELAMQELAEEAGVRFVFHSGDFRRPAAAIADLVCGNRSFGFVASPSGSERASLAVVVERASSAGYRLERSVADVWGAPARDPVICAVGVTIDEIRRAAHNFKLPPVEFLDEILGEEAAEGYLDFGAGIARGAGGNAALVRYEADLDGMPAAFQIALRGGARLSGKLNAEETSCAFCLERTERSYFPWSAGLQRARYFADIPMDELCGEAVAQIANEAGTSRLKSFGGARLGEWERRLTRDEAARYEAEHAARFSAVK